MGKLKKHNFMEILVAFVFCSILFYGFIVQPLISWTQQNTILALILGIFILIIITVGGYFYLKHRKKKNEEFEIIKKKELTVIHKKELEGLSEEEKIIMINKRYQEEVGGESILNKFFRLFSRDKYEEESSKKVRIPIPNEIKTKVYERAAYNCQKCGKGIHPEIHHIDHNPSNNIPSNLIVLCPTCHAEADSNDLRKEQLYSLRESQVGTGKVRFR